MIFDRTRILKTFFWLLIAAVIVIVIVIVSRPRQISPETKPAVNQIVPSKTTTLFFAGDIMLSRNVADKIIKANDYNLPFAHVADEIRDADISFANLESPFLDKPPYAQQGIIFKAEPKTVEGLIYAGFDVLSTANNHASDQSLAGIMFTITHLMSAGIMPVGTGTNCQKGARLQKNGIKFGFLAYSYAAYNDAGTKPNSLVCDWKDTTRVTRDIQNLKSNVDFVILSAHMGTEYQRLPDDIDVLRARQAVDAGADLIVGHHPHWIQTMEQYRDKWIFYSLGNFVFDQMWSRDTRAGLTMTMTMTMTSTGPEIKKIELKPVIIDDYCCPRWANDEESLEILKKVGLTDTVLVDNND